MHLCDTGKHLFKVLWVTTGHEAPKETEKHINVTLIVCASIKETDLRARSPTCSPKHVPALTTSSTCFLQSAPTDSSISVHLCSTMTCILATPASRNTDALCSEMGKSLFPCAIWHHQTINYSIALIHGGDRDVFLYFRSVCTTQHYQFLTELFWSTGQHYLVVEKGKCFYNQQHRLGRESVDSIIK